jgi:hypothetical protein
MTFSPEELVLLCEIEERGRLLSDHIDQVKDSIEFEALTVATSPVDVDQVMSFTKRLDVVVAEYSAFQTQLRQLVALLRLKAGAGP